jgi:hypothetical protein
LLYGITHQPQKEEIKMSDKSCWGCGMDWKIIHPACKAEDMLCEVEHNGETITVFPDCVWEVKGEDWCG